MRTGDVRIRHEKGRTRDFRREKAAAEPDHAEEWGKVRAYFAAAWPRVLQALAASRKG